MVDILTKISTYKKKEVALLKAETSRKQLQSMANIQPEPRGFLQALRMRSQSSPALIAEIKKASPSKGLIREDFHPASIARAYQDGGACCLSVLTDTPSFQGSLFYMKQAKAMTTLPILRKDFMVDTYQVLQSRAFGADAILIIMAMVSDTLAKQLLHEAARLGMDAMVETHSASEMRRAIKLGAKLIGINNRNLKTFTTSLSTFETLAPLAPPNIFLVAESAIHSNNDILQLTRHGARAFLVGESLMRQEDVELATKRLLGTQPSA